jgi:hypothetical protein
VTLKRLARIRTPIGLAPWIWMRIEIKSLIRICIKTNADTQHWLQLPALSLTVDVPYSPSMCQLLPGVRSSAASLELQLPALPLTVDVLP